MTWVKIDDGMPNHPKVIGLSVNAKWSLIELWCYSAAYRTDGYVEEPVAKRLAKPKILTELVDAGLLHRNGKGWAIHDWLDHNISKENHEAKKAAAAERQKRWREEHRAEDGSFHA